jgi:hypothetical protein
MPAGREEEAVPRSPLFYPRGPETRSPQRRRRPFLAIFGIILLLVAVYGLYMTGKWATTKMSSSFLGKAQELPVATPTNNLKPEVERLAERIRSAHLNKDINKWLSCYASSYPKLGQLENSILELWKNHDVKEVSYRISNVQPQGNNQATAVIVWSFQVYDQRSHDYQLLRQSYRITLEKSNGGDWKIKDSKEEVEPKA